MGTLLQHGSETKKRLYLPQIATGALRLQAFGVTEPSSGTDTDLLTAPVHPYTRGLLASVPDFRSETATGTKEIPGIPPNQAQLMPGCRFADRCDLVLPACHNHRPRLQTIAVGDLPHRVACPVVIAAEGIATHD